LVFVWVLAGLLAFAVLAAAAQPGTDWGGPLSGDTFLDPAGNPHLVHRDLIVPAGVTLTVNPGVEMYFAPGVAFIVRGRLWASGTPTETILLTARDDGTRWTKIIFDQTSTDNLIAYAIIERHEGLVAQYSSLRLLHSEIHDVAGDAVVAIGGTAVVQGNHIYDVDCVVHGCEGIQIKETPPDVPAQVLDNHVHHVSDDCLDINDSSVVIRRNVAHHCGDKGISVGSVGQSFPSATQPASTTLVNNLIYSSTIGIAVKDSAFARILHNTVVQNKEGLALYEAHDHPGYGGGRAQVINTILWDNEAAIRLDLRPTPPSSLTVTASDVAGGWPGQDNLDLDPAFLGTGDYHLERHSPLVDAGQEMDLKVDLDGAPRPVGGAPDIGAYEVQSLLALAARPGDRRIFLAWQWGVNDPVLDSFAISYTRTPQGSVVYPSRIITGLPETARTYVLDGLSNYTPYAIEVQARDALQTVLYRSNRVTLMPTDRYVYLPLSLRLQ
jgi:parallel beta-helix repeat protein